LRQIEIVLTISESRLLFFAGQSRILVFQRLAEGKCKLLKKKTNRGLLKFFIPGLLTSQGEDWYQFRSKVQQPMMRPKSALRYTK
jgi:hypothetical protein